MNSRKTGWILRIFHLISECWKKEVDSEHSCCKWIIPEVSICYLYPEFPFFFSAFDKKRVKIWEFILQMDQIPSCHIHSSTRFFIFFQWILKKRDKFCEFIRKWLTNFVKSPQVCNKSYNDLETVLKKKKKKGTANISGIAIKSQSTTSIFFNGGLGAIEQKPTIFKINNWRKTSWRRQIITIIIIITIILLVNAVWN